VIFRHFLVRLVLGTGDGRKTRRFPSAKWCPAQTFSIAYPCYRPFSSRFVPCDQRRRNRQPCNAVTRAFIRVLRLLETFTRAQLTDAVNYALDLDVIDPDSIRVIVEYRSQEPVELFSLDGRPELARVRVETTDVSAYQALLMEDR
jgi:hypothetical protein